jgi:hypothetical protein
MLPRPGPRWSRRRLMGVRSTHVPGGWITGCRGRADVLSCSSCLYAACFTRGIASLGALCSLWIITRPATRAIRAPKSDPPAPVPTPPCAVSAPSIDRNTGSSENGLPNSSSTTCSRARDGSRLRPGVELGGAKRTDKESCSAASASKLLVYSFNFRFYFGSWPRATSQKLLLPRYVSSRPGFVSVASLTGTNSRGQPIHHEALNSNDFDISAAGNATVPAKTIYTAELFIYILVLAQVSCSSVAHYFDSPIQYGTNHL